jgi:hypothetical protein
MQLELVKLDYHRNGICGQGFWVAIANETDEDGEKSQKLIIRFPDVDKEVGAVVCSVLDLGLLNKRIIEFGRNSWRGDHYSDAMDAWIAAQRNEPFNLKTN